MKRPTKLITVAGVATLLRLSESAIYRRVAEGRIPFFKDGRRLLFDEDEILASLRRVEVISS